LKKPANLTNSRQHYGEEWHQDSQLSESTAIFSLQQPLAYFAYSHRKVSPAAQR